MTVVALCDRLARGLRLAEGVGGVEGVRLVVLVSNNHRRNRFYFLAVLAGDAVLGGPRRILLAVKLAVTGRLRVSLGHLEDDRLLRRIGALRPDVGLHSTGVIYRGPVISRFERGILNPHIGLLPKYRGRSVMEWSILNGDDVGISTFFIDEGIDTGPEIVLRSRIDVLGELDLAAAKQHLFDLDVEMFRGALLALGSEDFRPQLQTPEEGVRFYAMSSLFTGIAESIFQEARRARGPVRSGEPPADQVKRTVAEGTR